MHTHNTTCCNHRLGAFGARWCGLGYALRSTVQPPNCAAPAGLRRWHGAWAVRFVAHGLALPAVPAMLRALGALPRRNASRRAWWGAATYWLRYGGADY